MGGTDFRFDALAMGLVTTLLAIHADAGPDVAGQLFDEGLAAMKAGRLDEGCPKLDESYRLDPRPGGLFTLAECENRRGRIATAAARYTEYLRMVDKLPSRDRLRQQERVGVAKATLKAIEGQVPRVTLTITPSRLPRDVSLRRDGRRVDEREIEKPISLDPGAHVFSLEAPSGERREFKVELRPGETRALAIDATFSKARRDVPAASASTPSDGAPSSRRTLGFIVGSVGLASLATGFVTGGLALAAKGDVEDNCVASACNPTGYSAVTSGRSFATASTITFAVGAAATAAGVVLILTAPSEQKTGLDSVSLSPSPDASGASVGFTGRF